MQNTLIAGGFAKPNTVLSYFLVGMGQETLI